MTFVDTDEYLVPMRGDSWHPVLDEMDRRGAKVLKMRSSRGQPRTELMEVLQDPAKCKISSHRLERQKSSTDPCLVPRRNETFLRYGLV